MEFRFCCGLVIEINRSTNDKHLEFEVGWGEGWESPKFLVSGEGAIGAGLLDEGVDLRERSVPRTRIARLGA